MPERTAARVRESRGALTMDNEEIVTGWSRPLTRLLGWGEREALGESVNDVARSALGLADRARKIGQVRRTGLYRGEARLITRSNDLVVVAAACVRTNYGFVVVTEPITKRPQLARKDDVIPITPDLRWRGATGIASPPMPTMTDLSKPHAGLRITMMRERAQLSKRQLAAAAGVHVWQLRQWENGDHVPSPRNLQKLIPHIGGTIEFYLFEEQ